MELKKKIDKDLKTAMLGRDMAGVTVLRGLKAMILDAEVAAKKREAGLSDEEIERVVAKEVKKRNEAIEVYEANGRGELVESEKAEKEILERYLPKQLSDTEIVAKIDEVLQSLPEGTTANMGMVMGRVKMLVGSGADGAVVARLVKERIS